MKIAILGNGGREHAIALQISRSKNLSKLYCIPGNAGTSLIAENKNLKLDNFDELYDFLKKTEIDLVIVGPEKPLVDGIVDFLDNKNIKVFGPNQKVSQLEGSKIFTKKICEKYNIPTAKFGNFYNKEDAFKFLKKRKINYFFHLSCVHIHCSGFFNIIFSKTEFKNNVISSVLFLEFTLIGFEICILK